MSNHVFTQFDLHDMKSEGRLPSRVASPGRLTMKPQSCLRLMNDADSPFIDGPHCLRRRLHLREAPWCQFIAALTAHWHAFTLLSAQCFKGFTLAVQSNLNYHTIVFSCQNQHRVIELIQLLLAGTPYPPMTAFSGESYACKCSIVDSARSDLGCTWIRNHLTACAGTGEQRPGLDKNTCAVMRVIIPKDQSDQVAGARRFACI